MEIICRIIEQGALQEREYQNRQTGNTERFASMGFVLQSGGDSFYAEMVQEQARKQGPLARDFFYKAQLQAKARPWDDQQGVKHYENSITIIRIALL